MTGAADAPARSRPHDLRTLAALAALGLVLIAITVYLARTHTVIGWNLWVLLLILCGFITIAATSVASKAPPGIGLAIVLAIALVLRLVALGEEPILSNDINRYVWDGMVQAAGINPYRYVPADPALADLRDAIIFPNINRAEYATTAYPPVAQFFFLAVTRFGESITIMRLGLIGCEVVTLLVIIDLLRRLNKPVTLATAYAWHPLAVWEIANSGHIDGLMVTLVMVGVWLLVRNRRVAAAVLIALGALAKPYAIVALPAVWRPWDWRVPAAVILALAVCYLPYLGAGKGVFGFVTSGYMHEEGFQDGSGFWIVHAVQTAFGNVPGLLPVYLAFAAGTLGLLAFRAAFASDNSPERLTRDAAMLFMVALFFLTPNYPWYYLIVVAFIPLGGGAPAWVLSIGALTLNLLYPDWGARFLLWKGVFNVGFLIAVLATMRWSAPYVVRMQGLSQWTR